MNSFQKIISFFPLVVTYLRGHQLFIKRRFGEAIPKFEKCLKHPKFHFNLLLSLYGQSLCATGRLGEGHKYLMEVCKTYESEGWEFKDQFSYDNALKCIDALEQTFELLQIEEGREFTEKQPKVKRI